MKAWMGVVIGIGIAAFPAFAMADNVVAIYAPNLDFKDGAERNAYVNKIAKVLSSETGENWSGQAFGRAGDFEAARANIDVAILDADYFTGKSGSLKPVAMLSANGQTSRPLKIIAKKGSSDKLYNYRGKKIAVVANASLASSFVTASVLGNEVKASEYFSSIDEVRDVRSAINAVEMGKADISLVFDGYDSGFTTVYTSPAVGLPIIAVNSARVTGDTSEKVKHALQNISIRTSSFVTGSAAYSASEASAYKRIANTRKSISLSYQPMEPEVARVSVSSVKLRDRTEGIEFNPFQMQYVPTIAEFDKKLEKCL
ncbi:MAG: PhnD/SsuA/transferrin family substrate-binding protein [Proteobacteria bacterium]|nr:PhnD/SsuA/transferrin family substrate-binding protein [Pseudomonadota bacterium]